MTAHARGGSPARRILAALVYHGGVFGLVRWLQRRRLLVVTYHGVLHRADGGFLHRNCVSVEEFDRQVAFLKRHYRLLTLEQALGGVGGRAPLPPCSALITFDDGFRNNAELAGPVLAAHGVPAVMFVTTGMLDRPGTLPWVERLSTGIMLTGATALDLEFGGRRRHYDLALPGERLRASDELRRHLKNAPTAERERVMGRLEAQCPIQPGDLDPERFEFMSWEDARGLAGHGVDVGSHTVRHLCLSTLDPEELRDEIGTSRRRIEEELGRPCLALAYPDGTPESFGPRDREALRAAGYRGAFSQIPGTNAVGDDLFALKRFNVPGGTAEFPALILTLTGLRRSAARRRGGPRAAARGPETAEVKRQVGDHFGSLAGQYHHLNYEAAVQRGKYPDIHMRHLRILSMLDGCPRGRALEIGVGGGELLAALHQNGQEAFGVDLSPEMAASARSRVAAEVGGRVKVAAADLEHLCFPAGSFDLVVAAGVIEYLPAAGPGLAEIARVLKPNGVAIVSIRNRFSLGRPLVALRNLLEDYSFTAPLVRAAMTLYRRLARRAPDADPVFARRDLPWRFRGEMRRHGLRPIGQAFYHFSVFPGMLERRFPRFCIGTGMRLEARGRTLLGYLGRGCIVMARKDASRGAS